MGFDCPPHDYQPLGDYASKCAKCTLIVDYASKCVDVPVYEHNLNKPPVSAAVADAGARVTTPSAMEHPYFGIQQHLVKNTLREISFEELRLLSMLSDEALRELLDSAGRGSVTANELRDWCEHELDRMSLFERFSRSCFSREPYGSRRSCSLL